MTNEIANQRAVETKQCDVELREKRTTESLIQSNTKNKASAMKRRKGGTALPSFSFSDFAAAERAQWSK
jgi:hypothetical protein